MGQEVFRAEEEAVRELSKLIDHKETNISAQVLLGDVNGLVEADRILASTAIAGRKPK